MKNLAYQPKKYSYADLVEMDTEERYEIIDGELYLMSSPTTIHQMIAGEIYVQLATYLKGKKCRVFIAPLDVKLSGQEEDKKEFFVVQPDVVIVCEKEKITSRTILGAPDFAVEILSPSTKSRDRVMKLNFYQQFGVKEYWIISPEDNEISVYLLNEQGIYTIPKAYYLDEEIKVNVLEDCKISLKELIQEIELFARMKEKDGKDL